MPYRILRNSPHHNYQEGEIVDLDKDDAKKLLERDPPLVEEVESKEEDHQELHAVPPSQAQQTEALRREAEQGSQMPEGPQAQRLPEAKQEEHAGKGLESLQAKQAQQAQKSTQDEKNPSRKK